VTILLVILYVLVCVFLILVVLLQQGKGADLAGAFGGGGSQTSFGPRSASNIMHRMTTGSFVLFVVLSLALAILSGKQHTSVMDTVAVPPATTEGTPEATGEDATGEAVVPSAVAPSVDEEAPAEPGTETEISATDEPAGPEVEGATEGDGQGS
jgi:preprotein translocase subunit SecG